MLANGIRLILQNIAVTLHFISYLFIFGVGPGTARTLGYIRKYVHVSICTTELRQCARRHRNARSLNGIKFSQPEDLEMQIVLPGTSRQLARHYAEDNDVFDLRQQLMPSFRLFPGLWWIMISLNIVATV